MFLLLLTLNVSTFLHNIDRLNNAGLSPDHTKTDEKVHKNTDKRNHVIIFRCVCVWIKLVLRRHHRGYYNTDDSSFCDIEIAYAECFIAVFATCTHAPFPNNMLLSLLLHRKQNV